ncbi:MAG: hypothetical protein HGA95_00015 [Caldiserica bacterium]|nr:hypothetical protein [Caldisericota bacterium]
MGQIKKLIIVLTLVVSWLPPVLARVSDNSAPADVCWLMARFDNQSNTAILSWVTPPDSENISQIRIYADFLDGKLVGQVGKSVKTFAHKLDRSMVGIRLDYTIKTFSQTESEGLSVSIIPTAADITLTGLEDLDELWPGQTYKIGVKRNRYATGKLLIEAVAQSWQMETSFTTILDETQKEFYFTGPGTGGKVRFDFWLGEDRLVFIKSIEYKLLSPSEPITFKLVKPVFGQHVQKGSTLEIAWEQSNLPKGGNVKVEIWRVDVPKMITELAVPAGQSKVDWTVPARFRHDMVAIVVYCKHLINYYPNLSQEPVIVCLDKTSKKPPSKPVIGLTPDQKRNLLDLDITCFDDGSEGLDQVQVTAEGSDGSTRNYSLKPQFAEGESSVSVRLPFYHVKIGTTYTFKAVAVSDDGNSPTSDVATFAIPNDWSHVYIESLKPDDSIQVGSRFRLTWSVKGVGEYLGADSLKFITPKNTYEMTYFKTTKYAMSLEDLLEGFTEIDDVRVWLSVVSLIDSKGTYATYFDCVDGLKFVSPPKFDTRVEVAVKKVNMTWEPYPKADYYVIKKRGYGEKFARLKTLRGSTTFLDQEVTPDSDFWYQIEARNDKDAVIARSDFSVKTPFVEIFPQTNPGKRYVSLSWDRVSWIEGFNVFRKQNEKWVKLNADVLSGSDYIDQDLIPGQKYCYKVEGVTNEGRIVAGSEEICANTEFEEIEAKIATDTQTAEISWSSTTGVDSYGIKRLTSNGMETIVSGILGNRYTDKNLDQDKEYVYQVVGMDKDGNEIARSAEITVKTQKMAIIELQAEPQANTIKLRWTRIDKISKLELWKDGKVYKTISTSLDAYLDVGLLPKTRYCYNLKAFNSNGSLVAAGQACFQTTAKLRTVVFTVNSKAWTIDGIAQPPMSVAPEITGGSFYLVTRYLAQSVGAGVSWDAKTKTIGVMRKDGYWFNLQVGNPIAVVNGVEMQISSSNKKVAPYIKNGYTFCPFRFLANNLGAKNEDIIWDGTTRSVKIVFR